MHPIVERYSTPEMLRILSYEAKISRWLRVEAAIAEAQAELGIIPGEAAQEISRKASLEHVSVRRVKELERALRHEVLSVVEALIEVVEGEAKNYVHYGVTSSDVIDTANALMFKEALEVIEADLRRLIELLIGWAERTKDLVCVGRTHGQHALPTTYGMKFALWAAELARHLERLWEVGGRALVGKVGGAVGTMAAMGGKGLEVQRRVLERLGLREPLVTNQVVQRDRYAELVFLMALIASTLEKIAKEVRNLQRTEIGEVMEPFRPGQAGSSTMPHKRNPHRSERVCSLARYLRSLVTVSLENIPLEHERDLTNSANERIIIFDSLMLTDYLLREAAYIVEGLTIDERAVDRNLHLTKGVNLAERAMLSLVRKGMDRVSAYRLIQRVSIDAIQRGLSFREALSADPEVRVWLSPEEIEDICNPETYLGEARSIVERTVKHVKNLLETHTL